MAKMRAWRTGSSPREFELVDAPIPSPAPDELLISVIACGICRTDLHVIDQEIPVHRDRVIPGHQVVGQVVQVGSDVRDVTTGTLVGVAWLHQTCGACEWCRSGAENLCPNSRYTGWDVDGGFAEFVTAPAAYVYRLADDAEPAASAPLLCAGIIGYRALSRANLPPGGRLGLYGFGSSAHLVAQIARAGGAKLFVMSRGEQNRALAEELGADFVGDATAAPPEPLDSAIVFAPAGGLVPVALNATRSGGTVVLAGIEMTDIPSMSYQASLFRERDLRTVTANTRSDGRRLLDLAANLTLRPKVTTVAFDALGDAIDAMRNGRTRGSMVALLGDRSEAT